MLAPRQFTKKLRNKEMQKPEVACLVVGFMDLDCSQVIQTSMVPAYDVGGVEVSVNISVNWKKNPERLKNELNEFISGFLGSSVARVVYAKVDDRTVRQFQEIIHTDSLCFIPLALHLHVKCINVTQEIIESVLAVRKKVLETCKFDTTVKVMLRDVGNALLYQLPSTVCNQLVEATTEGSLPKLSFQTTTHYMKLESNKVNSFRWRINYAQDISKKSLERHSSWYVRQFSGCKNVSRFSLEQIREKTLFPLATYYQLDCVQQTPVVMEIHQLPEFTIEASIVLKAILRKYENLDFHLHLAEWRQFDISNFSEILLACMMLNKKALVMDLQELNSIDRLNEEYHSMFYTYDYLYGQKLSHDFYIASFEHIIRLYFDI